MKGMQGGGMLIILSRLFQFVHADTEQFLL